MEFKDFFRYLKKNIYTKNIRKQLTDTLKIIFESLKIYDSTKTQNNLPKSVQIFAVDYMIDIEGKLWVLELNANPNFVVSDQKKLGMYNKVFEVYFHVVHEIIQLQKYSSKNMKAVDFYNKLYNNLLSILSNEILIIN